MPAVGPDQKFGACYAGEALPLSDTSAVLLPIDLCHLRVDIVPQLELNVAHFSLRSCR